MSEEHKKLYNFFLSGAKISSNRKPESLEKEIRYSLSLMENVKLVSGDSLQWVTRRTVDGVNYVITKQAREYEEDGISISPKPEYFIAIEAPHKEVEKPEPVEEKEIERRLLELKEKGWELAPAFCIVDPEPDFDIYRDLKECDLLVCAPGGFDAIVCHVPKEEIPWLKEEISLKNPLVLRKDEGDVEVETWIHGMEMASAPHGFNASSEREDVIEDHGWVPGPIPYMGYDNVNPHFDYFHAAAAEAGAIEGHPEPGPGICPQWFDIPGTGTPEYHKPTYAVTEIKNLCNYHYTTHAHMKFHSWGMLPSKFLFADYSAVAALEYVHYDMKPIIYVCMGTRHCLSFMIDYWKEERYPDEQKRRKIHTGLYHYRFEGEGGVEAIVYDESQVSYEREMNFRVVHPIKSENTTQHDIDRGYGSSMYELPLYNHSTDNSGGIVEREDDKDDIFFYLYVESIPDTEYHTRCRPWNMVGVSWGYNKNGVFYNGDNTLCGSNYEQTRQRNTFKLWANVNGEKVFLDEVELTEETYGDEWFWYDVGCCGVYSFFGIPVFVYAYRLMRAYYSPSYGTEAIHIVYGYFIGDHEIHIQSKKFFPLGILSESGAGTQWHDIEDCVEKFELYGSNIATVVACNTKTKKTMRI